jgi:hypothetical protein
MMRLVKKLRPQIIADVKAKLACDVRFLQAASSDDEFKKGIMHRYICINVVTTILASQLLQSEWALRFENQQKAKEVANYFFSTWVNSNLCTWYEGFSNYVSINNGLESRNAELKKITFRKKLSLNDFVQTVQSTLMLWSGRPEEQVTLSLTLVFCYQHFRCQLIAHGSNQSCTATPLN